MSFDEISRKVHEKRIARDLLLEQLSASKHLDGVVNFRVNDALKKEFSKICNANQTNASTELKRYMLQVVRQGRI